MNRLKNISHMITYSFFDFDKVNRMKNKLYFSRKTSEIGAKIPKGLIR